jgi:hypothetical protein
MRELKPRAIFFDGISFLLWNLVYFVNSTIVSFKIILSGLGVIFGLGLGVFVALRRLAASPEFGKIRCLGRC